MMRWAGRVLWLAALVFTVSACSVTRFTPQGRYVLMSNEVRTDREVPKRERISADDVEKYIQQGPAKRFLGTNFNVWLYNSVQPDSKTWWARGLHNAGTPPVELDTAITRVSADYIGRYVRSRGYFDGSASCRLDTARRKARVTYTIKQGEPYRIGRIIYDFRDKALAPIVLPDTINTLLKTGAPFDSGVLDAERTRIKDNLTLKGYYTFTVNKVRYLADSTAGGRKIDVTVVVDQYLTDHAEDGTAILENNPLYRIGRINVYPDYDPTRAVSDTSYMRHVDTLEYKGLNIVYGHRLRVKKEVLRDLIGLHANDVYSSQDVSRTYSNLMRLGYYRSARIVFSDAPDSTRSMVTFIGADGRRVETSRQYLICNIYCTPSLRQSYNVGLEATFTSDYYGLSATVGYRNRSLFRGVEMFDVSFTGSYDFMRVQGKAASFEFGGKTSITFPRFVLPFHIRALDRVIAPRTRLELSVNAQRRPYYHRVLSNGNWGYSWGGNRFTTFTVRPIDVGVVKVNYLDQDYIDSQHNPYLRESYKDQLLAGISGSWVYNNSTRNTRGDALNIRLNWETKGNLLYGAGKLFGHRRVGEDYYRLLGIRFAEYVRADLSVVNSIPMGGKFNLVWRLYGGAGITYGNSYGQPIPYDRLFYAGGSNSMRGWIARTLGPGSEPRPGGELYPSQLGNMRLETNLEGRFPIWSILRGALFFDAGNVWLMGPGNYAEVSKFQLHTALGETALNTGVGLRIDLSMSVLRLDWGIRLHDPNLPAGQRWIQGFKFANTALSVAVGYPF